MLNLKGHRSVGGMRASIYNAVPEAAVDALIEYHARLRDSEHGLMRDHSAAGKARRSCATSARASTRSIAICSAC